MIDSETTAPVRPRDTRASVLLPAAAILVIVTSIALAYVAINRPDDSWQGAPLVVLSLIGIFLAVVDSKWLMPYSIVIWATSSEIRRLVDWQSGAYHNVSLLSLLPLIVCLSFIFPVIKNWRRLPTRMKQACIFFCCAAIWATLFGVVLNGLPALYESINFIGPALIVPYLASRPFASAERDAILSAIVSTACILAVYGWWQYVAAPPWDMLWLKYSGMTSSMGQPGPMQFRMFSTMASASPAAVFFAFALALDIINSKWRGRIGILGIPLLASALAITEVRSAWLALIVMILANLAFGTGRAKLRTALTVIVAALCFWLILPYMPGGDSFVRRSESLTNLQTDYSAQSRTALVAGHLPAILSDPVGTGMGSTGIGDKLNHLQETNGVNGSYDNGFLALLQTFGVGGFLLLSISFLMIILMVRARSLESKGDRFSNLSISALFGASLLLMGSQVLSGMPGAIIWTLVAIPLAGSSIKAKRKSAPARFAYHASIADHDRSSAGQPVSLAEDI